MSELREAINSGYKKALKEKQSERVGTIRLISAALKDRDINARSSGNYDGISDDEILALLQSMIKQRGESIRMYNEGGRPELAAREQAEIDVIQEFLPTQLSDAELEAAIKNIISDTGAESIKDMGKVMGVLKTKYAGQIDMGKAGPKVKEILG